MRTGIKGEEGKRMDGKTVAYGLKQTEGGVMIDGCD